jgi:hypothetical protein
MPVIHRTTERRDSFQSTYRSRGPCSAIQHPMARSFSLLGQVALHVYTCSRRHQKRPERLVLLSMGVLLAAFAAAEMYVRCSCALARRCDSHRPPPLDSEVDLPSTPPRILPIALAPSSKEDSPSMPPRTPPVAPAVPHQHRPQLPRARTAQRSACVFDQQRCALPLGWTSAE